MNSRSSLVMHAGLVVVLMAQLVSASAVVRYVNVNNPNPIAPYTNWATAATVIQDAVDVALSGDEVLVTNGVYQTGGRALNGGVTNRVAVNVPIILRSVNGADATVIQGYKVPGTIYGTNAVRGVYLTNHAVLTGFTVTGGATMDNFFGDVWGGGIQCEDNTAVISNCVITGNAAWLDGGGAGQGTLSWCSISNNTARGYSEGGGGGVAYAVVNNSLIIGNIGTFGGGAIYSDLNNCLITDNTAVSSGGGVYSGNLNNCTVTDNQARNNGGGTVDGKHTNSIVYYNDAPSGANHYGGSGTEMYFSCTTPMPEVGTNNLTAEPLLASFSRLSGDSPCVAAGDPAAVTGRDIDGELWKNPPSIGCDEFNLTTGPLTVAITTPYSDIATGYPLSLRADVAGNVSASVWDFGDGVIVSNRPVVVHQWNAAGDFNVIVRAYNSGNPGGVSATTIVHVVSAPTHHVSVGSTNPQAPYLTWATAATNIQDAVDAAYPGGMVLVTNGIYNTGFREMSDETNRLVVTRPILVQSVGGPEVTSIIGGGQMRCVYLTNGATLAGFTVTSGYSPLYGGGVFCESAAATVSNCVIRNSSGQYGGGVYGGAVLRSLLRENSASYGGAAYGSALNNCLVISNSASNGGGGAHADMNSCTLVGNTASSSGGGAYFGNQINSIIYYNQAASPSSANTYVSAVSYSCTTPDPGGTGNLVAEPGFVNRAAADFHLRLESPCRDVGDNSSVTASIDFDGNPRLLNDIVDLGAYEFDPPPPPPPATPFAFTGEPTTIRGSTAQANGFVSPNGYYTRAWFEWGLRGDFTHSTTPLTWVATSSVRHQTQALTNLLPQATYQYRLVASNIVGVTIGATRFFTTGNRVTAWGQNAGQLTIPPGFSNVVSVAGGGYHSIALHNDGSVASWGLYPTGFVYQPMFVPAGLTNVARVTAGTYQNLALRTNGTVAAWGMIEGPGGSVQPAFVPPGVSNVVALSARSHTLALRADGTVTSWGYNERGQTNVPAGLSNVVTVAAGWSFSLALHASGTVSAWGQYYNLGNYLPMYVPDGLTNVVAIAAGFGTAFALRQDGAVFAWGADLYGLTNVPANVTNIVAIAAGRYHCLALDAGGALATWGAGLDGQTNLPVSLSAVAAIASGEQSSYALGNVPPVSVAQTVNSAFETDAVITLTATDANSDALKFRITTLPVAGALYQFSSGARGAAITNVNTTVSDSSGRVIFAPEANGSGAPYATFEFAADDGLQISGTSVVSINVLANAPFAHTLLPQLVATNAFTLAGMATPNGLPCTAWFQLGMGTSYTNVSAPQAVGAALDVVYVQALVSGLTARETYRCRLVVSNQAGITFGAPKQFRTGGNVFAWGNTNNNRVNVPSGLHGAIALAAGSGHSLVLKQDGRVIGWGSSFSMAANVPTNLNNVTAIATGDEHGLALRSDGTLAAWGNNLGGEVNIPSNLTAVVSIAANYRKSGAIRSDGRALIWGQLLAGVADEVAAFSNVVAIALQSDSTAQLLLLHDGTVRMAGYNPYPENHAPAGLSNVVAIAGGTAHWLALRADGTVVGWGANFNGQTNTPPGLTNVIAIEAGYGHSLALRDDGTLIMWGAFYPETSNDLPSLSNVADISAGSSHNLALVPNQHPTSESQNLTNTPNTDLIIQLTGSDPDGDPLRFVIQSPPLSASLYQFTNGTRGVLITSNLMNITDPLGRLIFAPAPNQIGNPYDSFTFVADDGDLTSPSSSIAVSIFAKAQAVTSPANDVKETSARLNGFGVPLGFNTSAWFEWGTNTSYVEATVATPIGSGFGVVHISQQITGLPPGQTIHFRLVASNTSQIIYGVHQQFVTGGKVMGWGDNSSGQSTTPTNPGALVSVAGGLSHSLALRANGTVVAWGNNIHGQTNVPLSLGAAAAVAAGGFHNLALLSNGNVVAWGRNNTGQTNVAAGASNVVQIAAGGQHSIALRSDGTLVAWGDNSQGQRVIPPSSTNIVGIAAGWFHNVALRSDGSVMAWGANNYGQTNVPVGLTNVTWVGAGLYHSLALRRDGTLIAWGLNSSGQTNTPASATNIIAAAGGGSHNLVQRYDGFLFGWGNNFAGQTTIPPAVSNVVNFAAGGSHSLALLPNHPPVAFAQTVAGYPNTDLLIALNGSDADGDSLTHRINALPTAGVLYQYNSGVRGVQILTADSVITDTLGRLIFAPAADQAGSPHSTFDFSASDGFVFSSPATVTVNVVLPLAPIFDLAASTMTTNGTFQLAFTGASNAAYRVWASTNLVNWELLGIAAPSATGHFVFLDSTATNSPQRFYRATAP